jgi:hypothetical protein
MFNKNKSLLFVSDCSPNLGMASPVIFHRHLSRLEDAGWRIHLLLPEADEKNYSGRPTWRVKFLPNRLWWYPPFRPFGALASLRYCIFSQASAALIAEARPHVVLGYLRGMYFSGLAAHLARKHRLPLGYIYHDATELFPDMQADRVSREHFLKMKARMIRQSSLVWVVSEEMLREGDTPAKTKLLWPLSEDVGVSQWPAWRPNLQTQSVLAHAGTVYNEIVEPLIDIAKALSTLGGRLLILTNSTANARRVADACPGQVEIRPAVAVAEACATIMSQASALLIAYPRTTNAMPWIKSCFPSKFVQFTATGLPTILFAPPDSALDIWAKAHDYPGVLAGATVDELKKNLARLLAEESWSRCAQRCQQLWQNEFNPDRIHQQFAVELDHLAGFDSAAN